MKFVRMFSFPGGRLATGLLASLAVTLMVPAVASAQLSALGASTLGAPGGVRGTDSAFDPVHQVWLAVGAYGGVQAMFVDGNQQPVGTAFSLNGSPDINVIFAHYARVIYSQDLNSGAGGFLVTWHQNDGVAGANLVHTRIVSYTTGLGASSTLNADDQGSWWEFGAPAAYSPISKMFLVAWQTCCGGGSSIKFGMVNLNGQRVGAVVQVSGGYGREPGVAWNPTNNEFGISYDGEDLTSVISAFARVSGSGVLLRRNAFHRSIGTYITDLAYNPVTGHYVMVYSDPSSGGTRGAEFDVNGDAIAEGVLSTTVGAYDGLAVSYNGLSGTFLMTGHHATSLNVGALELNMRGGRSGNDRVVSSTNPAPSVGSFYPRPSSSTIVPRWLVTYSRDYIAEYLQGVETSSTAGAANVPMGPLASSGPSPSPSPSPTPAPGGCVTGDPFVALGGGTCINGGWYPPGTPTASPTPTPTPTPPSGSCAGTDPFVAMGGGTCYNGGWYPPGTVSAPAPTPAPTPTPTPRSGGCATGDPFAAMGGGVCVNGGWYPPGMFPTPPPAPAPPPPPTSSNCPGTDPFVAMGGGTCWNGGWYPPGMISAPSPAPLPTPTPTPGTCGGTDPFVAIGGGVCINGGWIPRNMVLCSGLPDPFVAIGGGVCINGGWIPRTAFGGGKP